MLESLLDTYGDAQILAASGLLTGLIFGAAAQHSRFCLRAATVEVSQGKLGARLSIWLIAFCTALLVTQMAIAAGLLDVSQSRQLASSGSLSGAVIGGLMFGAGIILARGCASRLLVLSATGNLRALVSGLVVTLVAQASLTGVLAPLRERLAMVATVDGGTARDLLALSGLSRSSIVLLATLGLLAAIWLAARRRVEGARIVAGALLGATVALGWGLTFAISNTSFEVVPIGSVAFKGPSTDTLMTLITSRDIALNFGIGLVPGVFVGSMVMAVSTREWQVQRFEPSTPMERYIAGAVLMGFGAMLAGGCAVGAGVSGGAVLSLTAWVAVGSMWLGALASQLVLASGRARSPGPA